MGYNTLYQSILVFILLLHIIFEYAFTPCFILLFFYVSLNNQNCCFVAFYKRWQIERKIKGSMTCYELRNLNLKRKGKMFRKDAKEGTKLKKRKGMSERQFPP